MDHASPTPVPSVAPDHDAAALAVVKRFLGGEATTLPLGNQPLEPKLDGATKVFEFTIDEIQHRIDALKEPIAALGFNGTWPGPRIDVVEGDRIRAVFKNNLPESTGIHFHGQRLPNNMDGVPHVTQDPIQAGASFTYEFVATTTGSHMYHSHHNSAKQVGLGLLGAFIVEPRRPRRIERADVDYVMILNDGMHGYTLNGKSFPATEPIVAKLGQTVRIRFMNEGMMIHPMHLHGMHMTIIDKDGWAQPAPWKCDTINVAPGERWDAIVKCDKKGTWAFHCHILPHAESEHGMFGMVTALVVG